MIFDTIIADESTNISNPSAKQTKAIKKLKAKHRIALTGTPVSNRPNEVWSIIDWVQPGALGNYWNFLERYCIKNYWGAIDDYQNLDELNSRLKRWMIRRMKADVLPDLPPKIATDVPFKLSKVESDLYDKIRSELLFEIEQQDISKLSDPITIQHTLVKMVRLRQLTDSMELLGQNVKSSKLEVLREILQESVQNGRKAIIFTQFKTMSEILARELSDYGVYVINGDVPNEERQKLVDLFNGDGTGQIMVMTSAGQYGLNIQRASVLVHYDQEWSLGKMEQREGRAHRIGQKDTVLVYNLLAKGTIDMYVRKVLHSKAAIAESVLGAQEIKEMLNYGD